MSCSWLRPLGSPRTPVSGVGSVWISFDLLPDPEPEQVANQGVNCTSFPPLTGAEHPDK